MFAHVCPHERAHSDDAHSRGTRLLEHRAHQRLAHVMTTKCRGHFRVDQRQRLVRALVLKKRRVAVDGELEPVLRPVVRDGSAHVTPLTDYLMKDVAGGSILCKACFAS
jgi:hypothetical protein